MARAERQIKQWWQEATKVLSGIFPSGMYENWIVCQSLYPHVQVVAAYNLEPQTYQLCQAIILTNAAVFDRTYGSYRVAFDKSIRMLAIHERIFEPEHLGMLTGVSNLALVLRFQGKYEAAEEMNRRALEGREKSLGRSTQTRWRASTALPTYSTSSSGTKKHPCCTKGPTTAITRHLESIIPPLWHAHGITPPCERQWMGGPNLSLLRLYLPPPGTMGRYSEDHLRGFHLTDLPSTIRDIRRKWKQQSRLSSVGPENKRSGDPWRQGRSCQSFAS